jgi:ATP-binding cassette, subfamily F, member 3
LLSINNLSFYFGGRALYEGASLHIKPKNRIALIGPNGTGKSTLLRIIYGEYTPDSGSIEKAKDCSIGFLNQDLLSYQSDKSILQVALEAFEEQNQLHTEIEQILHRLETEYSDDLIHQLTEKQERFEILGGYTLQAQAEEILEGLGFKTQDLNRSLKQFSGGWRMRVMLAKLLLQKPALLMLDEPTNHLDLPSIQWVENYIRNYEGAIIAVSHDREFLDNVCEITVEVSNQQLNYYSGNYSFYLEEKALRKEIQQSSYENQQQKIKQTEKFIERFKAKASKARQVQSKVKMLDKLDLVDEVIDDNVKVNFKFNFAQQSGKQVMLLEDVSKAYADLQILKKSHATIMRGDKIALIGANGKGKSTLLRIIAGTEQVEGKRELGYNVNFSFFAQHQLESLHVENEIIEELKQAGSGKLETELRGVLGCFLFSGDDAFKKIKVLSGGEKSRVALAKVLISEANFLLLDEPTNHLDIQSVNILVQALQQYQGTYIIVSHDRHFLAQVANKIWYIDEHQIKEYPGTYKEYEYWRIKNAQNQKNTPQVVAPIVEEKPKKQPDVIDKNAQKELKALQKKLSEVENEVMSLEIAKEDIEQKLASPDVYENPTKLKQVQMDYEAINQKIAQKQKEWESLVMEMKK